LGPYEELAVALAAKLAAEKEEVVVVMTEAYTRVGTNVTRGVRPVSVLGSPSSAAEAVTGASVSMAVRFRWPQQAGALADTSSASRFELSRQEPNRLRLMLAVDLRVRWPSHSAKQESMGRGPSMHYQPAVSVPREHRRSYEARARDAAR